MSMFKKAQRHAARARIAITGPSGSGKTLGALMLAKGLGGRIVVLDTERDSASLYSEDMRLPDGTTFEAPEFDTFDFQPPYSPERFVQVLGEAAKAGYEVIIMDSATSEWTGSGGCLELNEQTAKARFQGNTWSAWSDTNVRHRKFIDAMVGSPAHVIATMRSKTETAQQEDGRGKKRVVKLGMKNEQRDGVEYEFTTVLDLVHDGHFAIASKDRTGLFGGDPQRLSVETGEALRDWLASAKPEAEKIAPDPPRVVAGRQAPAQRALAAQREPDGHSDDLDDLPPEPPRYSLDDLRCELAETAGTTEVREVEARWKLIRSTLDGAENEAFRQAIQKRGSELRAAEEAEAA